MGEEVAGKVEEKVVEKVGGKVVEKVVEKEGTFCIPWIHLPRTMDVRVQYFMLDLGLLQLQILKYDTS